MWLFSVALRVGAQGVPASQGMGKRRRKRRKEVIPVCGKYHKMPHQKELFPVKECRGFFLSPLVMESEAKQRHMASCAKI
jgi:hypothetical protein